MEKPRQMPDYKALDQPRVLERLFHPRKEEAHRKLTEKDLMISVETGVAVGVCFHLTAKSAPTILFFHGNGEIVSDYDDLGGVYNGMGINFIVVDYRGYGRSTGTPSVSAMMADCHPIFDTVQKHLDDLGFTAPLTVMGRSLGSASALELAASKPDTIANLIIESGFAKAEPLLTTLGIDTVAIGFAEEEGFGNADKIGRWHGPTLIIHAEFDHIIPFSDGQALYDACGATEKTLLKIPNANHNDIFYRGMKPYMAAIQTLVGLPVTGR
ncbi:MAG: alpha/beta hydrolase [Desulfobacteraceae bacterium]|nr:alpha/beta hydrolase [Desulfobacteraceae bacterium]